MTKQNPGILAFNRGIVSSKGLARIDLQKLQFAAAEQENWMPDRLGPMSLRPGWEYKTPTRLSNRARGIPFVFATDDKAILEFTGGVFRVLIAGTAIARTAVSSAVTNGNFDTDLTGWTDSDEAGATSSWQTGGYMGLLGTGFAAAIRRQEVTVAGGDQNVEHALRVSILRGVVRLKVGSSSGGGEYFDYVLTAGLHSLTFTPTGNFHIELSATTRYSSFVDSINVESSGEMNLTTPYNTGDLEFLRFDQSADVVFLACKGYAQYRVERRSARSWSFVRYLSDDGPFGNINTGAVKLTPSATSGNITLTASQPFFRSGHAGAMFKIASSGQTVTASLTGDGQFTNAIRVIGIGSQRAFSVIRAGTWTGTLSLQRSIGEPGNWVTIGTYTSNGTATPNDDLDNQIIYYRIGFDTGGYGTGTAEVTLEYASGSIDGIVRISSISSTTSATAYVLRELGGTTASPDWYEGEWSDVKGWPSAVALYEGRLWWAGKTKIWGSVSDAFASYDSDVEGDSGPINRSIGSGPVDHISWLLPLQRLLLGTAGAEMSAKSSSFDEPLTPTAFSLKDASTYGSKSISPLKLDNNGIYVHRGGTRLMELYYSVDKQDYTSRDLNMFNPDICVPGIVRIGIQRMPDTRIHCVLADGTVSMLLYEQGEAVQAWHKIRTDGVIEDVVVLPQADSDEDEVYYAVRRVINGNQVRYWERWASARECIGGTVNKQADSFLQFSGVATATITGLSHLEGEEVVVWADGKDMGTFTVASGSITLPEAVTSATIGLYYRARYKSAKLGYGAAMGSPLTQRKRVNSLGLVLENTHKAGLRYGADYDLMDDLPLVEAYELVDDDEVWESFDRDSVEFPGIWSTDPRICLEAAAPRPCTVLATVIGIATHDKG